MGKTLYLECYSGISGDMTVAALLDLGADQAVLDSALKSLPVSGFQTKISRVVKGGIDACDFDVMLDKNMKTMIMIWNIFTDIIMKIQRQTPITIHMRMVQMRCICILIHRNTHMLMTQNLHMDIIIMSIGG